MKLALLGSVAVVCAATAFAMQTGSAQTSTEPLRVFGCLQGDGSTESPWVLRGAVLPAPPGAAAAAAPGGGRGDGAGRGAAPAGGGRGGQGGGRGGDGAGRGGDGARGAAGGGGRGGDAGRGGGGGGAAAAPAPAPTQPPVNLRLMGVNMAPWRGMYVEVHGRLGSRPASGPQEFNVTSARSAHGDCR
jgi:hypothetical protein